MADHLIKPHGDELIDLLADEGRANRLKGLIEDFTGISHTYEEPSDAGLVIDTTDLTPEEGANQILVYLQHIGYLTGSEDD